VTIATEYAVDFDFVACLENSLSADADQQVSTSRAAPDADAAAGGVTPDIVPGRPR